MFVKIAVKIYTNCETMEWQSVVFTIWRTFYVKLAILDLFRYKTTDNSIKDVFPTKVIRPAYGTKHEHIRSGSG